MHMQSLVSIVTVLTKPIGCTRSALLMDQSPTGIPVNRKFRPEFNKKFRFRFRPELKFWPEFNRNLWCGKLWQFVKVLRTENKKIRLNIVFFHWFKNYDNGILKISFISNVCPESCNFNLNRHLNSHWFFCFQWSIHIIYLIKASHARIFVARTPGAGTAEMCTHPAGHQWSMRPHDP